MEEEKQASSKSLLMNDAEEPENSPAEEDILVLKKHLLDKKYIEF